MVPMNGLVCKMSENSQIFHHKFPKPKMTSENCFFSPMKYLKLKREYER